MKRPQLEKVEVDMVPMIDIISLLLMFLIIVGDTASNASSIQMQLPREMDQAMTDKELVEKKGLRLEGRIVVQLHPDKEGKYKAVISNKSYDLVKDGGNRLLIDHLERVVSENIALGHYKKDEKGAVDAPVRLRIPEDAPMKDVELVVMSLARVGLVNVQYAADSKKRY